MDTMTKARIYNLAMKTLMEELEREKERQAEAERNGTPHRIADARIKQIGAEMDELNQMILDAEQNAE
jgi:hypothetical protein